MIKSNSFPNKRKYFTIIILVEMNRKKKHFFQTFAILETMVVFDPLRSRR